MAKRKYNPSKSSYREYLGEYRVYNSMRSRCANVDNPQYADYGGRGIKVCDEWLGPHGFQKFYDDMGPRPIDEHGRPYQIDRIDNDGDYCPENCRWITVGENQRNRRDNIHVYLFGEPMCISEVCRSLSINRTTVTEAIRLRGATVEEAILNAIRVRYKERVHE